MPAPDVTVVVPVYNTVDYLPACLDSLLRQTIGRERLEVVAVDDGSTDGCGPLLDEYAARHPDVVRVLHQENSGGPARPCNVGLDHATGRFVFFLGSDDYLADDALERMVAAADRWDSDVVVPPMAGVNERFVDQRLFQQEHPDIAFPGELLPFSLSNTKLFRRSLVEDHGLRYALDLRVGSDQPFTIAAMLAARRISVLATPAAYFAVKRTDEANITYRSRWRDRLEAIAAVIEHVAELVPAGDDRDALLRRHFEWELGKMVRNDLPRCEDEEDRKQLVSGLGDLGDRYLTDGVARRLRVLPRLRWWLVRHGRVDDVLALLARDDQRSQVHVEGDGVYYVQPGFRDGVPDEVFRPHVENVAAGLARSLVDAEVTIRDDRWLAVSVARGMVTPESLERISVVLAVLPGPGDPRAARSLPPDDVPRTVAVASVRPEGDDRLTAEIDLRPLVRLPGRRWSLRIRVDAGAAVYDLPVCASVDHVRAARVRHRLRTRTGRLVAAKSDRLVFAFDD